MPLSVSSVSKRARFISASLLLTVGLIFLTRPPYNSQVQWPYLLSLAAVFVTDFILGGTVGVERFSLLVLPAGLTLGAGLSQLFFPNVTTIFRVGVWVSFFLAIYAAFLALNVFKVVRLKGETIPLQRAARPAAFLLSFVAAFLLLISLHKLSLGIWLESLAIFLIGFVLSLSFLWTLSLADLFEKPHLWGALLVGVGLIQIFIATSFYPLRTLLRGLVEATFFYVLLGVARAYFEKHLNYAIVFEYIAVVLAIFLLIEFFLISPLF